MKNPIRLAIIAAGGLAALLAGLLVLGMTLDPGLFKDRIAKAVKDTTGLDVAFTGPIRVAYFPSLGVRLEDVTVHSPPEAGGGVLMKLGKADVSVKVLPLVSGRLETGKITLDALEVNLVRDEKGRLNLPVPPVKEVKVEGDKVVVVTTSDQRYSVDYQIEAVRISGSRVSFDDRMTGSKALVSDFSLKTESVSRGKPFGVEMGFGYALTRPDVSGKVELSGQGKAVLEAMQFAFENASVTTSASGKDLPVKDLRAQWTGAVRADLNRQAFAGEKLKISATGKGGVLPEAGAGFSLALDATSDLTAGTADITGLALDVMGFVLSGEVHATNLNKAPRVQAAMATNEFNPRQVLEKFGVTIQESGTAKASFNLAADMEKGTAELTRVRISALGLDMASEAFAESITGEQRVRGSLSLAECNPRQVMARLGQSLPPSSDPAALTKLKLNFNFEGAGNDFKLTTTDFRLDESTLALTASVRKAAVPKVDFAFKADALNLDHYLPPAESPGGDKKAPATKREAGKPVSVPAEVSGTVDVGKLTASKLHLQNVHARLSVKDNILDVNPATASLYQGSLKAGLRTDVRGGPAAPLSLNATLDGVQVEPLLRDMQGKSKLKGRLGLNAAVTAKGEDAANILATLGGKASFALRDGAILGINLSPDLLSAPQKLLTPQEGPGGTPIESVTASFAIAQGIARNNDLAAVVPPHRATGQGWINLAAKTLDYRLVMSFAKLAPIPVHVAGNLESPSITPDPTALAAALAKGVIENIPKNPQDLLKPENLGKGALDTLGNILGGQKKK